MTDDHGLGEGPMIDVARGDPALSRYLRTCLMVLRDQSDDQGFRARADEVLTGRVGLRDMVSDPVFARGLDPGVERFDRWWDGLSDEQRAELGPDPAHEEDGNP